MSRKDKWTLCLFGTGRFNEGCQRNNKVVLIRFINKCVLKGRVKANKV